MKDTVAAHRYAKALFAQAQASKQVLACQQGLAEVARITGFRDSLRRILSHPFIVGAEKQKLVHSALGEYATPLLERFFSLLVQRRRFELLPLIVQEFQDEVDRSHHVQALRVRSAYPLSDKQKRILQEKLEVWLHSKVRMDVGVDPELIGGLVVQTRDLECDQSLRGKLTRLRYELTE